MEENVIDILEQVLFEKEKDFSEDEKYQDLKECFMSLKNQGLISPPVYTLPPIDTIGSRYYQQHKEKDNISISNNIITRIKA
ncbi:MAG: hypothetical protein LBV43_10055 [Prevotella sp.]|jgi:hypothetical protein|nr:hypothetical protein [Prevotella sp.]